MEKNGWLGSGIGEWEWGRHGDGDVRVGWDIINSEVFGEVRKVGQKRTRRTTRRVVDCTCATEIYILGKSTGTTRESHSTIYSTTPKRGRRRGDREGEWKRASHPVHQTSTDGASNAFFLLVRCFADNYHLISPSRSSLPSSPETRVSPFRVACTPQCCCSSSVFLPPPSAATSVSILPHSSSLILSVAALATLPTLMAI